jgi:hypothetical protein
MCSFARPGHRGNGAARQHDSRGRLCRSLGDLPASYSRHQAEPRRRGARTAASMVYLWTALGPEINQVYVYLAPTEAWSGYIRRGPARLNRKMQ